jgi:GGDEF domain-containing protein
VVHPPGSPGNGGGSQGARKVDVILEVSPRIIERPLPEVAPLPGTEREQLLDIRMAATPRRIASSAGIAASVSTDTADALLARADAALYDAKRHARPIPVARTNR